MLISAATYGRSGPTHTASLMYGENLSLFSRYFGAKSVPSARRPTSLARSTILRWPSRSEEHTSELQSLAYLVCRLLLEKKKKRTRQKVQAGSTWTGSAAAGRNLAPLSDTRS